MKLNMQILADCFPQNIKGQRISESVTLELQGVRLYQKGKRPDWENYVYIMTDFEQKETSFENWGTTGYKKHLLFLNMDAIPEQWAEEEWILLSSQESNVFVLEQVQHIFDWFQEWERRLLLAKINKMELQSVMEIIAEALPNPVALLDSSTSCLAWAGNLPEERDPLWDSILDGGISYIPAMQRIYKEKKILEDVEKNRVASIYKIENDTWPDTIMANIYDADTNARIGNFGCTPLNAPLTNGQVSILEYLSKYIEPVLKEYNQAIYDSRKQNFRNALAGGPVSAELLRQVVFEDTYGKATDFRILLIKVIEEENALPYHPEILIKEIQRLFFEKKTLFVMYQENIVALSLNLSGVDEIKQWLDTFAKTPEQRKYCIGISRVFTEVTDIRNGYLQAMIATEQCNVSSGEFQVIRFEDVFYRYAAKKLTEELPLEIICHPVIYQIWKYDQENGTSFLETVNAYLEENSNVSRAAKRLYLHRNTMIYRLDKIRELFGETFLNESPGDLLFSLKLLG